MNPDEISAGQRRPAGRRSATRTVLTMDDAGVSTDGDVLVTGDTIAAVGAQLAVPDGALEIDASRRHRHAGHDRHAPAHVADRAARHRRGLDAQAEHFHFCHLPNWGKVFRPQDVYAGNLLSALEALDAGGDHHPGLVTRLADRRPRRSRRRRAPQATPGRFVLAYGNLLGAPWEWGTRSRVPAVRRAPVRYAGRAARARNWPSTSPPIPPSRRGRCSRRLGR